MDGVFNSWEWIDYLVAPIVDLPEVSEKSPTTALLEFPLRFANGDVCAIGLRGLLGALLGALNDTLTTYMAGLRTHRD